jgi:agmatinase
MERIEAAVEASLAGGSRVVVLGGDHAVSYPVVRAYAGHYPNLNILHFDAHPDLYDNYEGNPHSHACPFARIMEERLATRLVQIGIRTANRHQREQAARFGVEMIEMRSWQGFRDLAFDGPLYISLDLDALDPAFAPGVSHREPGGLSVRELIGQIQRLRAPIAGADIVEYNPGQDIKGVTATVAAKLLKEIAGQMLAV